MSGCEADAVFRSFDQFVLGGGELSLVRTYVGAIRYGDSKNGRGLIVVNLCTYGPATATCTTTVRGT